jgi:transposase
VRIGGDVRFGMVIRKPHPTVAEKKKICAAVRSGQSIAHVSQIFQVHRSSIHKWVKASRRGISFQRKAKPGSGRLPKIDCAKGCELLKILKRPASEYGFENDCWTTARIRIVCKKYLGLEVSRMAIFRTLQRYEHAYKTPQRQYYETNVPAQKKWLKEVVPEINRLVKRKQAILYFTDESNLTLSPTLAKTWAPIGKKVVQKVTGNRGSVAAISAISKGGYLLFNLFAGGKRFKSADIIKWLEQMLAYHPRRHLVIVMDRAKPHTSKKTREFVASQKRLHVFYLPPRSPELNPDEQVWAHLKGHQLKSHKATTEAQLKSLAQAKLRSTANNKKKVRGIFKRNEYANYYL